MSGISQIKQEVETLRKMNATDPAASSQVDTIMELIRKASWIPDEWKPIVIAIVVGLLAAWGTWNVKPPAPPPAPVPVVLDASKKITYVLPAGADVTALLKDKPSGIVETYPVGTVYAFGGKQFPLPVVVVRQGGIDISVEGLR